MNQTQSGQTKENKVDTHILKKQIIQSYFTNGQQQFDGSFVDTLFQLARQDQQIDSFISKHSLQLLLSSQAVNKIYLLKLLKNPKHAHIAHNFIKDLIELNITVPNRSFQLFIIQHLSQILMEMTISSEIMKKTIVYLALKMRSFDLSVRITSLKAFKELGEKMEAMKQGWDQIFKEIIPLMIQKQKLAKQVSYTKGLFLQILQDQFSEVRKICMQTLILFKKYIKPEDLKLIIIYMLNDQHQVVREETLIASKHLKDQLLVKEDLETILMCLRQKRANMRKYVYQTLSEAYINESSLLLLILEKALITLQTYKSDKKHIYKMLYKLGKIYHNQIGKLVPQMSIFDTVEPNWKNITYKAKMIFCYSWWANFSSSQKIPQYFGRHMLYIKDIEQYLFEQQSSMLQEPYFIDISRMTQCQLSYFIECQEQISQEFHKRLLYILKLKVIGQENENDLLWKLEELVILYNLKSQEIGIIENLRKSIQCSQTNYFNQLTQIVKQVIKNREDYEEKNIFISKNICKVSQMEANLIVSSKSIPFQQKVILKCYLNPLISKEFKMQYKKLVQLNKAREDEQNCYLTMNLTRYNKIECVLLLFDNSEQLLSTYMSELKI